jgi:hypothetical protein
LRRRRIRTSRRSVAALVAAAAVAGGCGSGEPGAETTRPPQPTLPRTVADDLAARSEAIADALDAGDVCTAAVRADELRTATIEAINNGDVPAAFQEDLQARANELVNAVNCPPPAATTQKNEDSGEGKGRKRKGKARGEEKKKKSGHEETVPTTTTTEDEHEPAVTEPPPTPPSP